jgi:hypothetical protein
MVFVLIFLLLGGCNPFGAFRPTSDELLTSNWAPNPDDPCKAKKEKKQLYCYRTLGETVCYAESLGDSEAHRLVGKTPEPFEKKPTKPAFISWLPFPIR